LHHELPGTVPPDGTVTRASPPDMQKKRRLMHDPG
jgi:hypothetical protein